MSSLKKAFIKIVTIFLILSLVVVGCGKEESVNMADASWEYERDIEEPIKAISSNTELKIGNLEENKVEIHIPGGTFDNDTEIVLETPEEAPNFSSKEMTPLGSPIYIYVGESETRLNEIVTFTVKLDPNELEDAEKGAIYATYYNGEYWQYIKPTSVDLENHTMTFTTSHFSLMGKAKLTVDERIKKFTNNAALSSWAQDQSNSLTNAAVERVIDHILKDKLKLADDSLKGKIYDSLLKDDEWGSMTADLASGNVEGFNKNLQILVGKKIVENVPTSKLSKALGGLTSDFGIATVEKASEAAGYLAEGRARDAAKILGEHIADQFMFTTAAKITVSAIDNQISSWKNEEIEAAYQAYKNGASSSIPWWGYQVEKGNFSDVWNQMGGAARQLEIEAIKDQEEALKDAGMPGLTEKEKDKIREMVRRDLKKQFEERLETDKEIEYKQAQIKSVMDMYKESDFFERGRWGYEGQYELEQRMEVLLHFSNKVLKDTGREEFRTKSGHNEKTISTEELKSLAMTWFGTDDPKERYEKYASKIKEIYGISLYPPASELNGVWKSGSITITEYNIPPAENIDVSEEELPEGCDLTNIDVRKAVEETLQKQIGKPSPMSKFQINIDGNGVGTTVIGMETSEAVNYATTYQEGVYTAKFSKDGVTISFNGQVSKTGDNLSINGNWKMTLEIMDSMWIKGTWTATK